MIKWEGYTTDKSKHYTEYGKTYKDLYNNIQEKYGVGNIIDDDIFERTVYEINGVYVDVDIVAFEEFDTWLDDEKLSKLTDEHYKEMILASTSQVYYHEFDENYK